MAMADRMFVAAAHFPAPFGRIMRVDGARAWSAA